jgi:S1-C subfamily serine protease
MGENQRRMEGFYLQKLSPNPGKHFLVPLKMTKMDNIHDLALFSFDPDDIHRQWSEFTITPLKIADDDKIEMGQDVVLFGYYQTYTVVMALKGSLAGTLPPNPVLGNIDEFLFSLDGNQGFSGGPIVATDTGAVVGVMEGFLPNPIPGPPPTQILANGISRGVRSKYVKAFLSDAKSH